MPLNTLLAKYVQTNASVVQQRRQRINGANTYTVWNNTDAAPLAITIWPLTQQWRMKNRGQALEDLFGYALGDPTFDLKPGDTLTGYPAADNVLEVASVNIIDAILSPIPHLSGVLRQYTHQG